MNKLKIVELVISAVAAFAAAAKSVVKFIDYIFKIKHKKAAASAA